jgi:signal peptidase II
VGRAAMTDRARQVRWVVAFAAAALIADQVTKAIVRAMIAPDTGGVDNVFFQFVRHTNTGIVGGMFHDVPFVAYVAPVAAMFIMAFVFRSLDIQSKWQSTAFGLVCGGAIGNMIDRLVHGGVTDFLQVHFYFVPFDFPWKYYPAFNVADSCVVVGGILLVFAWGRPAQKESDAPRPV